MWEIEKGKSNLVFEVVRKDSYASLSRMVDDIKVAGLVIAVHDSRYLRKIVHNDGIETYVVYPDKTQVIDPRVLRDRTVMRIQDFLSNNDEGIMLVDVLEELGKRFSSDEMEKTVQNLVSFKSCRHTLLATLNPVVLPKDMVRAVTPYFDAVQDVRAASIGIENVECPNCGAQWDSLVTVCSMCGYNLKTHTIRVSTPSEARPQKAEGREAPRAVTTPAEVSKPVKPTPVATPEPAEPTPKPKPQARKSKKKKGKEDREPMQKIGKEEKSLPPSQATPPPISKERDTEAFLQAAVPLEGGVEESGIGERERGDSIGENGAEERRMGEKNGLEERRMGENVGKPADGRVKREEFLENLTFKFLSTETEAAAAPMVTPMRSRQTVDWFSRGVSLELKGDSRGALEAYDNALNASPNDPWIWLNEGVALQRLGRLEEALKCYDESIKLDPTDPDVWSNRATALRGLGRLEEAVESYKRALEKNPDDGGIWSNLGIALRTMGRFDEALTAYESALELIPKDVTVWLNKAAVLSSLRRFDDAMECYDHILYLDPGNAGVKELKRFLMRRMKLSA